MLGIASPSCGTPRAPIPEKDEFDKINERLVAIAARIEKITHEFDRLIYYYDKYLDNELKRGIHLEL